MVSAWKRCTLHPNGHPGPPCLHGRPDICLNVGWVSGFIYLFFKFLLHKIFTELSVDLMAVIEDILYELFSILCKSLNSFSKAN